MNKPYVYDTRDVDMGPMGIITVGTESLEETLIYNDRYLSETARIKDEQIYCYVPDQCFDLDDDALREYIKTYID